MIAVDSSVLVAGFGAWHEKHAPARAVLGEKPSVAAHSVLECYSVLTRLPEPFRAPPDVVRDFLEGWFPGPYLSLDDELQRRLVARLVAANVMGGAVYDGLIGLTVSAAGARLLTLDRRALRTYARCGVAAELLSQGGLRPGVDLDDSASLRDVMDGLD